MPFSDPMADGPAIQASSQRALKAGQTMEKTLAMVGGLPRRGPGHAHRANGLLQPHICVSGRPFRCATLSNAGVDGLIVVDMPPEEDAELRPAAKAAGLNFIRLATPTTDARRLPAVLANTTGFVYYVSIAGITGTAAPDLSEVKAHVGRIKAQTGLPVAVGFGVKTEAQVSAIGSLADGVVVGSALVDGLADSLDRNGKATPATEAANAGACGAPRSGALAIRLKQRSLTARNLPLKVQLESSRP